MSEPARPGARTRMLAALSLCTDLANGLAFETAIRAAAVGLELARGAGLSAQTCSEVFVTGLLRFLGCTAYAHEEAALAGGDDLALRRAYKRADPSHPGRMLAVGLLGIGVGHGPLRRAQLLSSAALHSRDVRRARGVASCEVGVRLAQRLNAGQQLIDALNHLHERWDGAGDPAGLRGAEICVVARVTQVAGVAEHYFSLYGSAGVKRELPRRRGSHLDPDLVDVFMSGFDGYAQLLREQSHWDTVREQAEAEAGWVRSLAVEDLASAFADFVDLQTIYTLGHSSGVADLAKRAAAIAGLTDDEIQDVLVAGYLHDLGAVSVPTGTWEKPGPLSESEWERVRLHPYQTERILASCDDFRTIAEIAGAHHERPNGRGYFRGTSKGSLGLAGRLLATADTVHAMSEPRAHRTPVPAEDMVRELEAAAKAGTIDPLALGFVMEAAGHESRSRSGSRWPNGLTDREVDVLRELARGRSNQEIAERLTIGARTVRHHVTQIYAKTGLASRAGAALFAIEQGLMTLGGSI